MTMDEKEEGCWTVFARTSADHVPTTLQELEHRLVFLFPFPSPDAVVSPQKVHEIVHELHGRFENWKAGRLVSLGYLMGILKLLFGLVEVVYPSESSADACRGVAWLVRAFWPHVRLNCFDGDELVMHNDIRGDPREVEHDVVFVHQLKSELPAMRPHGVFVFYTHVAADAAQPHFHELVPVSDKHPHIRATCSLLHKTLHSS